MSAIRPLQSRPFRPLDAFAVDELKLVGGGRETADTDADQVAVLSVGLDPLRQQFLVGQRACNAIAKELCDGRTIEVSRNCADGTKHANSSPGAPLRPVSAIAVFQGLSETAQSPVGDDSAGRPTQARFSTDVAPEIGII